jgi:hypothetical protein
MRTLIVITLLALTGCAAQAGRSYQASNTPVAIPSVADRTGAQASAPKSGNAVKSGAALTPTLLDRPGRL